MSKEVKRYELRIVDRYAGDGTGDIETDARMKQEAKGRYVLFSDYEALLAERDAYKKALEKLATVPGCGCSFPCRCGGAEWTRAELEGRMDYAAETLDRAALQGAQP